MRLEENSKVFSEAINLLQLVFAAKCHHAKQQAIRAHSRAFTKSENMLQQGVITI
jgi:hypothetical protein